MLVVVGRTSVALSMPLLGCKCAGSTRRLCGAAKGCEVASICLFAPISGRKVCSAGVRAWHTRDRPAHPSATVAAPNTLEWVYSALGTKVLCRTYFCTRRPRLRRWLETVPDNARWARVRIILVLRCALRQHGEVQPQGAGESHPVARLWLRWRDLSAQVTGCNPRAPWSRKPIGHGHATRPKGEGAPHSRSVASEACAVCKEHRCIAVYGQSAAVG